jgi:Xaa-Pro aminopeptidase
LRLTLEKCSKKRRVFLNVGMGPSGGLESFALNRACKNPTELEWIKQVFIKDSIAFTRLLYWLDQHPDLSQLTESCVAERLEDFRKEDPHYFGPSFPTISAYGSNGAIVHYHPDPKRPVFLKVQDPSADHRVYLLDAGGQYWGGTTDHTRTIALLPLEKEENQDPTNNGVMLEEKEKFTRVLQAHLRLAMMVFPKGTPGWALDLVTRQPLWFHGLDFGHGTGHGVGAFSTVHEMPPSISGKSLDGISENMVFSNEPGYYQDHAYGIRIESIFYTIFAKDAKDNPGANRKSGSAVVKEDDLILRPLSWIPFDRKLIKASMLSWDERRWVDRYHRDIFSLLGPFLNHQESAWLEQMTQPLSDCVDEGYSK